MVKVVSMEIVKVTKCIVKRRKYIQNRSSEKILKTRRLNVQFLKQNVHIIKIKLTDSFFELKIKK